MTNSTSSKTYRLGNFQDPVGLIFRMLRSRNRAAYSGLMREGLRHAASPVDWFLSRGSDTPQPVSTESTQPIILIVGPPRSGTTLTYQILARYCDVTYPDNMNSLFPRASLKAMKLFSRKSPPRTPLIRSCYGQTARFSGPNEGFHIWNRWLGSDRYKPVSEVSHSTATSMIQFFNEWTSVTNRPFLNKNNRSTGCVGLLSKVIPTVHVVLIKRNKRDIIRSIIRGRKFVQGSKNTPWGLFSQNEHAKVDKLGYVDDVCEQMKSIVLKIQEQTALIDGDRIQEIDYAKLCEDPAATLRDIAQRIPGLKLREDLIANELTQFPVSTDHFLSPEEETRIDQALERFATTEISLPERSKVAAK